MTMMRNYISRFQDDSVIDMSWLHHLHTFLCEQEISHERKEKSRRWFCHTNPIMKESQKDRQGWWCPLRGVSLASQVPFDDKRQTTTIIIMSCWTKMMFPVHPSMYCMLHSSLYSLWHWERDKRHRQVYEHLSSSMVIKGTYQWWWWWTDCKEER